MSGGQGAFTPQVPPTSLGPGLLASPAVAKALRIPAPPLIWPPDGAHIGIAIHIHRILSAQSFEPQRSGLQAADMASNEVCPTALWHKLPVLSSPRQSTYFYGVADWSGSQATSYVTSLAKKTGAASIAFAVIALVSLLAVAGW